MIRRFLKLPARERLLILEAAILVASVRAALWVIPYRILTKWLRGRGEPRGEIYTCPQIAWAVSAVSRYVPKSTCLTQALAAETLLRKYGHQPSVHIGVAKSDAQSLEAHAWVTVQGRIILGDS